MKETHQTQTDPPQPRSTSPKQVAANRRNAQHSTGPKTPEGKAAVAQNAVKHGLRAVSPNHVVIPGEDPDEFQGFHDDLLDGLNPTNAAQWVLAERIVLDQWRLRRAARYEGQLMTNAVATIRRRDAHKAKYHNSADETTDPAEHAALELPRAVDLCLGGKAHWNMVRYEGHIERGMFRAVKELQELQKRSASTDPADTRIAAQIEAEIADFQREQTQFEAALQAARAADATRQAGTPHEAAASPEAFGPPASPDAFTPRDAAGAKQSHFDAEPAQAVADKNIARESSAPDRPAAGGDGRGGPDIGGRNVPSPAAQTNRR